MATLDLAKAIRERCGVGLHNTVTSGAQIIMHPISTAQTIVHEVTTITKFLPHTTGTVIRAQTGGRQAHAEFDELIAQIDAIVTNCSDVLAQMPLREKVKYATAFATEMVTPAKIFKMATTICSQTNPLVLDALKTHKFFLNHKKHRPHRE